MPQRGVFLHAQRMLGGRRGRGEEIASGGKRAGGGEGHVCDGTVRVCRKRDSIVLEGVCGLARGCASKALR